MKKIAMTLALAALPAMAFAAGIDITWDDCVGGTPAQNKVFNCAANANYNLQFQYKLANPIPNFTALTGFVDYQNSANVPLTPFWHYEASGCQGTPATKGAAMFDDISVATPACQNLLETWGGDGTGGFEGIAAYGVDFRRPGNGYFVLVDARGDAYPVTAGDNYWAFRLNFRTNNRAACAGCADQGIILWQRATFESNDGSPAVNVDNPDKIGNCVSVNNGPLAQCGIVPTRNTTWGQLKSIYR